MLEEVGALLNLFGPSVRLGATKRKSTVLIVILPKRARRVIRGRSKIRYVSRKAQIVIIALGRLCLNAVTHYFGGKRKDGLMQIWRAKPAVGVKPDVLSINGNLIFIVGKIAPPSVAKGEDER